MERPNLPTARRNGTRVQFPCRLSHSHLDEPHSFGEGAEAKYSVRALIPKEDKTTLVVINEAIKEAYNAGKISKWKGNENGKIRTCVLDGDEPNEDTGETVPENEGNFYINAKSKNPVGVFNTALKKIDPAEAYSGCYAYISVNFYPYAAGSKKGIGCGLNACVKCADGERFGGSGDGSSDFVGVDFGMTSELNTNQADDFFGSDSMSF